MSRITISVEAPTAADVELLAKIAKDIGVPGAAPVVGGYDAITITADLDDIRETRRRHSETFALAMLGGPL